MQKYADAYGIKLKIDGDSIVVDEAEFKKKMDEIQKTLISWDNPLDGEYFGFEKGSDGLA